jgi:hypothetical protein
MKALGRRQRSKAERIPAFVELEKIQIKFLNMPAIAMGTFKIRAH